MDGKENLDIKKLEAFSEPTYRLVSGDHRIIYQVKEHIITVAVIEITPRKDAYRKR